MVKSVPADKVQLYIDDGWVLGEQKHRKSSKKGSICIQIDGKCKYIQESELDRYLADGWIRGNTLKGRHYNIGVRFTQEHKDKIGMAGRGKVCVTNGEKNRYVKEAELPDFLDSGWVRGSCKKPSKSALGKKWITDGEHNKYIDKGEHELPVGWWFGRTLKRER